MNDTTNIPTLEAADNCLATKGTVCCLNHAEAWERTNRSCDAEATHIVVSARRNGPDVLIPACHRSRGTAYSLDWIRSHGSADTAVVWASETTHGPECQSCIGAASQAISLAKCTGSTGCSFSDGQHVAKVSR